MDIPSAAAGFPDPALVVNYPTALRFVRYRLNRLAHGQMKPWAAAHRFNYARLVEIKKDDRQRHVPLMQRLFVAFGYSVAVIRLVAPGGTKSHFFWFATAEAHALFRQELRAYDELVMQASQF
ncbi:hypothetical protein GCM10023172_00950 [Hymenobacter ginsengisoli]|uniref:Uncharacterized protein n=1 Tax=Hymenobacter ginsengisoli TaxID=1051626 RepID=A0ABP8PW85_9BACT|nr:MULTISPECIES: hypothetical protein [unclassified Hymenobacter]MBO2033494.1 hypothetical protein [Hymenobacter sp. BT559]